MEVSTAADLEENAGALSEDVRAVGNVANVKADADVFSDDDRAAGVASNIEEDAEVVKDNANTAGVAMKEPSTRTDSDRRSRWRGPPLLQTCLK